MKPYFLIVLLCILPYWAFNQIILYQVDFDQINIPELPTDWSATYPANVVTANSTASNGYTDASGGNNLLAQNCQPPGELRSFSISNISTINTLGLEVSFGHRRTNSFTPSITFEWSIDGNNWNLISNITSGSTTWSLISFELPEAVEHQSNLQFRWSYTTNSTANCSTAVPNYKIDDFKLTAMAMLPVELIEFEARQVEDKVHLNWSTALELENEKFILEHSSNGSEFIPIAIIKGNGTSHTESQYSFEHLQPIIGINYYRLKQVDRNGKSAYSDLISIHFESTNWSLRNNLVYDLLILETEKNERAIAKIYDLQGKLVKEALLSSNQEIHTINISEFKPQIYFISISDGSKVKSFQFLKI